jgi:acetaldehyde dehydrogenase (acetylating)
MGHTMSIHSKNDDVILQFGLHKPAYRIVVNSPTTHGSIGLTTGLDPAMTLGCGGYGGNITSDNISPMHLLNIKRLAYETTPAPRSSSIKDDSQAGVTPAAGVMAGVGTASGGAAAINVGAGAGAGLSSGGSRGLSAETLRSRIDSFLASRGFTPGGGAPAAPQASAAPSPAPSSPAASPAPAPGAAPPAPPAPTPAPAESPQTPAEFVCEDDVRQAMKANRKILLGERTIVTPSARDLGEQHHVFVTTLR